ncbi:MAG: aldo/keto reductase [Anaerolineaceae bacterium]|nr:aldo/keto reductase [Anaerolineaceae bacterium]MDD4043405.1 aldo/keto reductase [Anaerolineaceae bacterium]MDD4578011.1 aldo/keto reductase [Anaerolineaceae bacterium]
MEYRHFGNTGFRPSALGFGCMRLPQLPGEEGGIDEPEAIRMIRYAIDQGLNYIDTAWSYHGGQSEVVLGRVLQDGYREKVALATKMPSWLIEKSEDFEHYFSIQLERLQTDHIDFYLLHTLNQGHWDNYLKFNLFDWAEKQLADGRIRHLGFSFHDELPVFETILKGYDHWDFCQIQYNYMDTDYQAGERGLKMAAERGLGVVVMEPLKGGRLAIEKPPAPVKAVFDRAETPRKPAEWALQWLWNQPEVGLVLSGMSTFEQVELNLASASRSGVGSLSAEEVTIIEDARDAWEGLAPVACTHCEYCLPCPNDVLIPQIFEIYNNSVMYDIQERGRRSYQNQISEGSRADACIECGTCEDLCPQHLTIIDYLKDAHAYLSER